MHIEAQRNRIAWSEYNDQVHWVTPYLTEFGHDFEAAKWLLQRIEYLSYGSQEVLFSNLEELWSSYAEVNSWFVDQAQNAKDFVMRERAIDTMSRLGLKSDQVATVIDRLCHDEAFRVRSAAVHCLRQTPSAYDSLIEAASGDECSIVRSAAVEVLGEQFSQLDEVENLMWKVAVEDSDVGVRVEALASLSLHFTAGDEHLNQILDRLDADPDFEINLSLRSIASSYPDKKAVFDRAVSVLECGGDLFARESAIEALAQMHSHFPKVVSILRRLAQTFDDGSKEYASEHPGFQYSGGPCVRAIREFARLSEDAATLQLLEQVLGQSPARWVVEEVMELLAKRFSKNPRCIELLRSSIANSKLENSIMDSSDALVAIASENLDFLTWILTFVVESGSVHAIQLLNQLAIDAGENSQVRRALADMAINEAGPDFPNRFVVVCRYMERYPSDPTSLELLKEVMNREPGYVRIALMHLFEPITDAEELLIRLAKEGNQEIRIIAISLIGDWYSSERILITLNQLLKQETEPEVGEALDETIARMSPFEITRAFLEKRLSQDPESERFQRILNFLYPDHS